MELTSDSAFALDACIKTLYTVCETLQLLIGFTCSSAAVALQHLDNSGQKVELIYLPVTLKASHQQSRVSRSY